MSTRDPADDALWRAISFRNVGLTNPPDRAFSYFAACVGLVTACEPPLHPKNDAIPELVCRPRCQRRFDCGQTADVAACVNRCVSEQHPRIVYDNMGFVERVEACAQKQACSGNVDAAIAACWRDASLRWEPTPLARAYCETRWAKERRCGMEVADTRHCLEGTKRYSDAILQQLIDCSESNPCRTYGRCAADIVGGVELSMDEDRRAEFVARPVPIVPKRILVTGKVAEDAGTPVAGAAVCVLEHADIPCSTVSVTGDYLLSVPAATEITLVVTADDYGRRAVPLATPARDTTLPLTLFKDPIVRARLAGFGLPPVDPATGSVFVTVRAGQPIDTGVEGVTMTMTPPAAKGPLYFAPSSDPDPSRDRTSSWSSTLFVGVPPGTVAVTLHPDEMTCTPDYGGWPSPKKNTIRLSVVAGMESRVTVRCSPEGPGVAGGAPETGPLRSSH